MTVQCHNYLEPNTTEEHAVEQGCIDHYRQSHSLAVVQQWQHHQLTGWLCVVITLGTYIKTCHTFVLMCLKKTLHPHKTHFSI